MGNDYPTFDPNTLSQHQRQRLQQGKPLLLGRGVRITKNLNTGKLEGVPEEWINNYQIPLEIDFTKTVKTKDFAQQIRPQSDLPEHILQFINSQPLEVSKPTNFQHKIHLEVDANSPCGIKGMNPQLQSLIKRNDINPQTIKDNPADMIQILNGLGVQEQIPQNPLLSNHQFHKYVEKVQFRQQNPNNMYQFTLTLGKGGQCTVYLAVSRKNDKQLWAVRIMKVPQQQFIQKIKIEAAVMKMCSNKNIINYHDSYYYKNSLFMFIEYMDAGSLTQIVYQYMKKIPQRVSSYIMRQILLGLEVLHNHKQIHRDLKSDNILVNKKGEVKVADFGFAIQLTKQRNKRSSVVGTTAWMAPQLIKKEGYNQLIDVWSVGVIAVQLADGEPPFLRLPQLKTMYYITTKNAYRLNKDHFSPEYCDFVSKCLEKDVNSRWSIHKLLNHNFITRIGSGEKQKSQFIELIKNKKNISLSQLIAQS